MKSSRFLVTLFSLTISIYITCTGCKAGRPAREALPDRFEGRQMEEKISVNDQHENAGGLPFYVVDTMIHGKSFTAIYLSNPEFDSLAYGIVKSYEPFAGSLLNMMAAQGIKGALVDFRQNTGKQTGEAHFAVGENKGQHAGASNYASINVIFLWDELSYSRAASFMNELKNSALVAVKEIRSTESFLTGHQRDCFKPGSPGFN